MRVENQTIVHLDDRDVRQAAVNGGLRVELPPGTTAVVIRATAQESKESQG
jgi:hypothetical protein